MFISKSGNTLNAIYGMDQHGKPEAAAKSGPQGVMLSNAQEKLISNSKFFEAGVSMTLLDSPGRIADVFDTHAAQLAVLLKQVLSDDSCSGQQIVFIYGKDETLGEALQTAIGRLSAQSDQIGRQMNPEKAFFPWLLDTLSTPMRGLPDGSCGQGHVELLTKIRCLSAFGNTICQLMTPQENPKHPELYSQHKTANIGICKALLQESGFNEQAEKFVERVKEFTSKTRTPIFDNPLSRARSERMPMVELDGKLQPVRGIYEGAGKYGFGQVVRNTVDLESVGQATLRAALGERNQNVTGIAREGAPIADSSRPFTISETDMNNIPEAYTDINLLEMLQEHAMPHGIGINRWQPFGTFALESNLQGLPSAGAQSAASCDILMAFNILSQERIYGNPDLVVPVGLGIAAFMNFGAYHTFSETFPLAEAVAANRPYVPSNLTGLNKTELYERMHRSVDHYIPECSIQFNQFRQAHTKIREQLLEQHPDIDQTPQRHDIEFHTTPMQIEAWR